MATAPACPAGRTFDDDQPIDDGSLQTAMPKRVAIGAWKCSAIVPLATATFVSCGICVDASCGTDTSNADVVSQSYRNTRVGVVCPATNVIPTRLSWKSIVAGTAG